MTLDLFTILENAGIIPMRQTRLEIWASCPMHIKRTGKLDAHPSWSINKNTFAHTASPVGTADHHWSRCSSRSPGRPPTISTRNWPSRASSARWRRSVRHRQVLDPAMPILTEYALYNDFVAVPDNLIGFRHLQRAAIDMYEVRWYKENRQWVLPLRSIEGALIGAQYRQKGNVVTLPEGMHKGQTLFGFAPVLRGHLLCPGRVTTRCRSSVRPRYPGTLLPWCLRLSPNRSICSHVRSPVSSSPSTTTRPATMRARRSVPCSSVQGQHRSAGTTTAWWTRRVSRPKTLVTWWTTTPY